jgi:hypothetical protein
VVLIHYDFDIQQIEIFSPLLPMSIKLLGQATVDIAISAFRSDTLALVPAQIAMVVPFGALEMMLLNFLCS